MSKIIYTIGYSGFKIEAFTAALGEYGVSVLIDVRSVPTSRFFPHYNVKTLAAALLTHGIKYLNLKTEFGARQENPDYYTAEFMDYEKFAEGPQFKSGVKRVVQFYASGETVCLMCAEKDPLNCHRAILCGRELKAVGFEVLHIVPNKEGTLTESHDVLERRLMALYFKDGRQYGLFENDGDKLLECYKRHNAKIGYKPN
ncbi:hypothetical protein FACS1894211_14790 [Clostridia bacterium]|nr:hypothetical protein FACS1894211_14790 [Clostridia bacterium]